MGGGGGTESNDQADGACASRPANYESQDLTSDTPNDSQRPTQELTEDDEDELNSTQSKAWGELYPRCGTFPRLSLSGDSFKMGRRSAGIDYIIKESDIGSKKWFDALSKVQCEFFKNAKGTFIKDYSTNGTWINGNRIGKNNIWPLEHDSEICFAGAKKKVYIFRSTELQKEKYPTELTDKYIVSKELGRGACGTVHLGFKIPDLERVAIKVINKKTTATTDSKGIMNEVQILQAVNHPSIIRLEDVIDTKDYLFIVLELAEGGELFDKIIEKTKLNEREAKLHFYQIASAIQYLHSKNVCHRDLKPENILLCSEDDSNPVVKITDMGLSKLVDLGTLKTFCGTPQYLAPEVIQASALNGSYTLKVDCWSLGVILFVLLSGSPPFSEDRNNKKPLKHQILQGDFTFYNSLFANISREAKDLIRGLLKVSPGDRLSAEEILAHPWLQEIKLTAEELMGQQVASVLRPIENRVGAPPQPAAAAAATSPATLTALKRPAPSNNSGEPMEVDGEDGLIGLPEKKNRVEINVVDETENNAAACQPLKPPPRQ